MAYQPIENYGLIGNLQTAALVGIDGSIDWLCLPHFDSPSVFGAILDDRKGGRFRIAPQPEGVRTKQYYWPNTNVLITRFMHRDGIAQLEDYMPVAESPVRHNDLLVRRINVVQGRLPFHAECRLAFDYARARHDTTISCERVRFDGPGLSLGLSTSVPLQRDGAGVISDFILSEGQDAVFVLRRLEPGDHAGGCPGTAEARERIQETITYWQRWISHCSYQGRWREEVQRCALVLKLLTYQPTGALVAAPTTSLPESMGGARNWDYRYTWVRDSAFVLYALMRIGFTEEATRFMQWLEATAQESKRICSGAPLQLMYGIDGRANLPEEALPHLEGYCGSRPVRIGNAAANQLQLDIYGELADAIYLHNKYGTPMGYDNWLSLRQTIDWVSGNWRQPDEGIWEVRGGRRHFTYSKFMCWVALDRALRLAEKRSFPADRARWLKVRDEIYEDVMQNGWDPERKTFVQAYGHSALDASALLMPLSFFVAPNDPRMLSTIDAIRKPQSRGGLSAGGLVYRYDPKESPDPLPEPEGTFNMCSFWLVEAQTRAGRDDHRRLEDARLLFEELLSYANHLGLYAEQTGPGGEALGNFPQAFTHLALISAAFNLDRTLDGKRR